MKKIIKKLLNILLSILPLSFANYVYTKIISKTPLIHIVNKIIKLTIPKELNITEGKIILNQQDVAVSGMLALGAFEPYQMALFRQIIKPGMTVVDIGANIGLYSVIAGKLVGKDGKVFSFEPEKNNYEFLNRNIEANNLNNVFPNKTAVSSEKSTKNLFLFSENTGSYSLVDNRKTNVSVPVQTDTLDNLLKQLSTNKVDVIKMDIEGAEYKAFEGMIQTINNSANLKMMIEFFPNAIRRFNQDPLQFLNTIKSLGFKISEINEDKKTTIEINDLDKFIQNFPKGEVATNLLLEK